MRNCWPGNVYFSRGVSRPGGCVWPALKRCQSSELLPREASRIRASEEEEEAFREGRNEAQMTPILQKALSFRLQVMNLENLRGL